MSQRNENLNDLSKPGQLHADPLQADQAHQPYVLSEQDAQAVDALLQDGYNVRADNTPHDQTQQNDPRLAQVKAIGTLLNQWAVPPVPLDLMNRTLAQVKQARQQARTRTEPLCLPFSPGKITEIAATAAIVLIAFSLAIPMLVHARDNARKILCQSHLAQAGIALADYTQDFTGMLPRGQSSPNGVWWRVGQPVKPGQPMQSNSAHLYLLPRQGYINPDTLACPDNANAPRHMTRDQSDWANAQAVSYSYQNQYTPNPYRPVDSPQMAVLADKNPMFTIHSGREELRGNSRTQVQAAGMVYRRDLSPNTASRFHRSNGQNVLTADGNVSWKTDPIMPDGNDNIWLINKVQDYHGNESPASNDDVFLVP